MRLSILGLDLAITRKAAAGLQPVSSRGGWFPVIREPYAGAWQQNNEIQGQTALSNAAVFSCVTLVAQDVAKCHLRLMRQDELGIWNEVTNPAYSPFLRKPNRYQTAQKFVEQWITSKLISGNAYALKERDARGIVRAAYVLDPAKVCPMVASDGAVYYELKRNDLAGLTPEQLIVPASEVMHDPMVTLFHPLIGVTPLYACGLAALQGLTIQQTSNKFFSGGSNPGGVLTAPGAIGDETAKRLKDYWDQNFTGDNVGKVAILGDGLKYEAMTVTAADSQLIDQLRWTAETICACYHVPLYMLGIGPDPPTASVEARLQQYHAQCIQSLLTAFESTLDEGLGLTETGYGTEFDIDDLIWMDTATKTKAAADSVGSGAMSPNEARRKYYGLGPVKGGDTPYMQQQNYSLAALDERDQDQPFAKPAPAAPAAPAPMPEEKAGRLAAVAVQLLARNWEGVTDGL